MKYIFTLLILLILQHTLAQTSPWLNNLHQNIPGLGDLLDTSMARNNYTGMTGSYTKLKKNGNPNGRTWINSFKYDNKGFMISYEVSNSKNKKTSKHIYTYNDSLLSSYTYARNGKLKTIYEISRNSTKRISDIIKKDSKNKIVRKQHFEYNELKLVSRSALYSKNNKELRAIEYTYFDKRNMKQAKEFKKGKLKKVWNYTCEPAGIKEEKVKEMKVCKNVNVDENGNRVETNRVVDHKGDVELHVSTFDKNDKLIKRSVYDDIKHRLKTEYSINYVNGNEESLYKSYNKRGKETFSQKLVYNKSHQIILSEFITNGKQKNLFKSVFEYNDKNLLTHSQSFDHKNRKIAENTHTFN